VQVAVAPEAVDMDTNAADVRREVAEHEPVRRKSS